MVSLIRRRLVSASDLAEEVEKGEGLKSSADLLTVLAEHLLDRAAPELDNLSESAGMLEELGAAVLRPASQGVDAYQSRSVADQESLAGADSERGIRRRPKVSRERAVQGVRPNWTMAPRMLPTSIGLRLLLRSLSQTYRPRRSGDHSLEWTPCRSSDPRERIDGTQIPTKSPWSRCPPNHSPTESRRDNPAATRIRALALRMASEFTLRNCGEGEAGWRGSSVCFIRFSMGVPNDSSHPARLWIQKTSKSLSAHRSGSSG
ncbi:MAG: hypothetical protein ACI8QC_003676 [Planctomycetota bacterium]|jgi:hypothetical protein